MAHSRVGSLKTVNNPESPSTDGGKRSVKIPEEVERKEERPGRGGRGGGENSPFHPRGDVEVKIGAGCTGARARFTAVACPIETHGQCATHLKIRAKQSALIRFLC